MSVESRLREATSELNDALSRVTVPPLQESSKARTLVAAVVASATVILVVAILFMWIDAPGKVATSTETTPLTSQSVTSVPPPVVQGTTSPREMTGPIEVIDPSLTRLDLLAALQFDLDVLGMESRLDAVSDPDVIRSWFRPVVWSDQDGWEWTIVGEVAGFEMPVVIAKSETDQIACAGREFSPLSCAGEGFQALADDELSPAVWLVPESTAVVGFVEHDNKGWQLPSGGAVAFPRFHLASTATLTAYDRNGREIAQVVYNQIVEINSSFDMLPQPPAVDLMRVLLDRGVAAIADTNIVDHNAPARGILGVADSLQVEFIHVDGSTSYAMMVSDGVRGAAIWSDDSTTLTQPFDGDFTVEDKGSFQSIDIDGRLIVTRGIVVDLIVDFWSVTFG